MFATSGGAAKASINAVKERQQDPKWSAPRITAADLSKYIGRDVTLVGEAISVDPASGTGQFNCIVTQIPFTVTGMQTTEVSKLNELTVYVESPTQLVVSSIGLLNDDFHAQVYGSLVKLIHTHHQDLFGA